MKVGISIGALVVLLFVFIGGSPAKSSKSLPIHNKMTDLTVWPSKKSKDVARSWLDAVGSRVAAEGLAWGAHEKGLGQRILLDKAFIYVRGVDLPEGKLVRVVGRLRSAVVGPAPRGSQGYESTFEYYYIEAEKIGLLDELKEWPKVTYADKDD